VLVHAGKRCESGHYLAFIKRGDFWYKANDEVVTKVSIDIVLRQQAYILFYEVEGMRVRHGYEGFHKYHKQRRRDADDSPSTTEPTSPPNTISQMLDSMLNICGSVETVRDAICDTDRKAKKKKEEIAYLTEMDHFPSSSSHTSPMVKSVRKKKSQSSRDSIFRRPTDEPRTSVLERLPNSPRESALDSKSDLSMIRSVSSSNIFEKEEEAISSYEKESYSCSKERSLESSRKQRSNRRSMSPMQYRYTDVDDEDRKSDTAVLAKPNLMRRKSNSAPRSRINESYVSPLNLKNSNDMKLPSLPRRPV